MSDTVFIGFNTTAENDVALRRIAAERRVDRTVVLNEAVGVYLTAQDVDENSVYGSINRLIDGLADKAVAPLEVKTKIQRLVVIACQDQRAFSEAECLGANDEQ